MTILETQTHDLGVKIDAMLEAYYRLKSSLQATPQDRHGEAGLYFKRLVMQRLEENNGNGSVREALEHFCTYVQT